MAFQTTRIDALPGKAGQEVLLQGWLYNRRSSGKLEFLQVRDGSGIVQAVMSKAEVPERSRVARPFRRSRRFGSAGSCGRTSARRAASS